MRQGLEPDLVGVPGGEKVLIHIQLLAVITFAQSEGRRGERGSQRGLLALPVGWEKDIFTSGEKNECAPETVENLSGGADTEARDLGGK